MGNSVVRIPMVECSFLSTNRHVDFTLDSSRQQDLAHRLLTGGGNLLASCSSFLSSLFRRYADNWQLVAKVPPIVLASPIHFVFVFCGAFGRTEAYPPCTR
jgi:hypothetical protein